MTRHYDDLEVGATFEFGHHTVEREEIREFAERYDPQPFHLDEAAAADSFVGELVASGWHTGALGLRMMYDDFFADVANLGGRGMERIEWHEPVRPGDDLSGTIEIRDKRPSESHPDRGYVDMEFSIRNQHGTVVMSMYNRGIVRRRGED
jgi:acyl dehydratase